MKVVNKDTQEILGELSSIEAVTDVGLKFVFEPFVRNHNFLVYINDSGEFGIASIRDHVLREEMAQ